MSRRLVHTDRTDRNGTTITATSRLVIAYALGAQGAGGPIQPLTCWPLNPRLFLLDTFEHCLLPD